LAEKVFLVEASKRGYTNADIVALLEPGMTAKEALEQIPSARKPFAA
jgi:hypothetical protein